MQLDHKPRLPVRRIRQHLRKAHITRHRRKRDLPARRNHSLTKLNRRNMTLARRPQAHDEPQFPSRQSALVRMRHNRRIEQRRRLQSILPREYRPDQQLPRRTQHPMREYRRRNFPEMLHQLAINIQMPPLERRMHLRHFPHHFILAQRQRTPDDPRLLRRTRRNKRPQNHPTALRRQHHWMPVNRHSAHIPSAASGCVAKFIAASAK